MKKLKKGLDEALDALSAWNYSSSIEVMELADDPETVAIKKESFENLSKEAKYVVKLVLNCPLEMFEMIGPPKTSARFRRKLASFLRREQGLGGAEIKRVLRELRKFVEEISIF